MRCAIRDTNRAGRETLRGRHGTSKMRKSTTRHRRAGGAVRGMAVTLGLAAMQHLPAAAAHLFPYVPTQILMPAACWNESICGDTRDLAYVFSQTENGHVRFAALNYSSTLGEAESQLMNLTTELPFLQDQPRTTAFGAARASDGSVVVYSGTCDGEETGSIWRYTTSMGDGSGGAWSKRTMKTMLTATTTMTTTTTTTTTDTGIETTTSMAQDAFPGPGGPSFLGATLAFSTRLAPTMDQPTIYTYGGMCNVPDTNSTGWQSSANYTTKMVSLAPVNSRASDSAYEPSVASTAGPRNPIAGFTLTQLPVSTTNISGSITQQAGFVLLGGHTQHAFINMSTAAVWNLPEQSWSYIDIAGPDSSTSELSMRDEHEHEHEHELLDRAAALATQIESRSGHTAVLAEDGASVIVFGGWVGDVGTPAEPQLVVLQLSQTYSSWRWAVPRAQPEGNGIYGHGAAMLPGNVMMVYGGWETSAPGGSTRGSKRQAFAPGGRALRFFNVTSSSWSNSYTNPVSEKAARGGGDGGSHDAPKTGDGEGDSSAQHLRLELGLGLGLGLGLLLAVLVAICLWRARRRQRRRERDEAVQSMAQDAQYFAHDADEMTERDDTYAWHARSRLHDGYAAGLASGEASSSLGYETLRGLRASLDEDDDGPYRAVMGSRQSVSSPRATREAGGGGGGGGGYGPAEARFSAFVSPPGRIHPIMEDDEEPEDHRHEDAHHAHAHAHALLGGHHGEPSTPTSEVHSDPFVTPTAMAPPVIFPPTVMTAAAAATTKSTSTSTSQPNRQPAVSSPEDHRLSDPDVQDWVSDVDAADSLLERYNSSRSKARVSLKRGNSTRSTALQDDESRSGSNLSESNRSAADSLRRSASARRSGGGIANNNTGLGLLDYPKPSSSSTTSSYNTARSGFATLQAEGPGLLLPSPSHHNPDAEADSPAQHYHHSDEKESEPLHPADQNQPPSSPSKSKPRRSWLGSLGRVFSHSSTGDTRRRAGSMTDGPPAAAKDLDMECSVLAGDCETSASAGAPLRGELLRRKQGRQDWEVEDKVGEDWDTEIERAVERRLVQVMFTVPKERLRVVNGGEDVEGEREREEERDDERDDEHRQRQGQGSHADADADADAHAATHMVEDEQAQQRHRQTISAAPAAAALLDPVPVSVSVSGPRPEPRPEKSISAAENPRNEEDEPEGRRSHSTDDSGKRSSGAVYLAEAVALRFERPRGRVLRMVQSIEQERERAGSAGSGGGSARSI
ncbi:hypothetical protein E4U55_002029 [Claviceps digitariae]|nr:hypothetical protein E4U55_002029 [Claviceps digitariae]